MAPDWLQILDLDGLLTTIFILVGIGMAIVALYALRQRMHLHLFKKDSLNARERIARETIETAIDQRSIFRIEFLDSELKGYKTAGTCLELTDEWLFIDMGGAFASTEWLGEKILVFFQTTFKRKPSFFQFHTIITDMRKAGNNTILTLPAPSWLDPGQQRAALRIKPHADAVQGIGVWPLTGSTPLPATSREMPPAPLSYRNGQQNSVEIDNLSSGGLRLALDKNVLQSEGITFEKGSRLLCLLLLKSAEHGAPPVAFWLAGTITQAEAEKEDRLYFGVRITTWAQMDRNQRPLSWLPLHTGEGVAPLAAWVMRHHLEQSKML